MNTDIFQQEILLLTNTNFSGRPLLDNDDKDDSDHASDIEILEQACWSGLLGELLPEIIKDKNLPIWQIGDTEFSLQIELSKYPSWQKPFSINPYYFLRTIEHN